MPHNNPTIKIKTILGLNNADPSERLIFDQENQAALFKKIENFDLDKTGRISRRDGYTKVYEGTNIHSLYTNGSMIVFVEDEALNKLNTLDYTATEITTDIIDNVNYLSINNNIYYSDGHTKGVIISDATKRDWGIEYPQGQSTLATTNGGLYAGRYQVAITYVASDGRESGARLAGVIELSDNQGIVLTNIPISSDSTVTNKRIYISQANGEVLYLAYEIANSVTSLNIIAGIWSYPLRTQYIVPPPVNTAIEIYNGRLYVAKDNFVYYSEPFAYEWFKTGFNFFKFPENVTEIIAVNDGIYVDSDILYFLRGNDPNEMSLDQIGDIKLIKNSKYKINKTVIKEELKIPGDIVFLVMTDKGFKYLGSGGSVVEDPSFNGIVFPYADLGVSLFRTKNNINQYIGIIPKGVDAAVGDLITESIITTKNLADKMLVTIGSVISATGDYTNLLSDSSTITDTITISVTGALLGQWDFSNNKQSGHLLTY